MIYVGTGFVGHWTSVVKEECGFVVYNDAAPPKRLSDVELQQQLRNGADFIFIAENNLTASTSRPLLTNIPHCTGEADIVLTCLCTLTHQSPLAMHHSNTTTELRNYYISKESKHPPTITIPSYIHRETFRNTNISHHAAFGGLFLKFYFWINYT